MRKQTETPRRLTPADWARAAIAAIARGGVDAVAVEAIAAELGATKGSFYWHFRNRDALVAAALEMWAERTTETVIDALEREADPAERIRQVLARGFEQGPADRAEIALLASPDHPIAVDVVRRVAQRRVAYIAAQLEALGWDSAAALDRASLLYCLYVGNLQLAHVALPGMRDPERPRRHVDLIFEALVAR